MADKFFIAPYDSESGLQNNVRPWLVPDTAFAELNNAYVWRGRVRKRFGSRWFGDTSLVSRLRVKIGTTDGFGNFVGTTPLSGGLPIVTPAVGQLFSIGTEVFTVTIIGGVVGLLKSGTTAVALFNTATGDVIFGSASISTDVYYYPGLPVMGLLTKEEAAIADEFVIGFDTRFAYQYASGWERLDGADPMTPNAAQWNGTDTDFFWGTTWRGTDATNRIFFVTNFNQNEAMRSFNGALWKDFQPRINSAGTLFLITARILVVFKNRLLAMNTFEGGAGPGSPYTNRCRYSQIGDPTVVGAWDQDVPGKGNAIDAPTSEAIVTAEFVKDRLIVYFERSTWELVYTGNQAFPFAWQQINTELGAESTFTIIPLESQAIGIGNVGIHSCNGSNVQRIDQKIPNLVYDIHNIDGGIKRVYGIRDYQTELLYWSYPDTDASDIQPFPTKVLVYNYRNNTWAINDDSITCFGFFQPLEGVLWSSKTVTWSDPVPWGNGFTQAKQRIVVAGNQQGYTFICDSDITTNAQVLQITNVITTPVTQLTIVNHNLRVDDYVYIDGCVWSDASNGLNGLIFNIIAVTQNTIDLRFPAIFTGTYKGGGTVARVSQISIITKQYNFYADQGQQAYISKTQFLVDSTNAGSIQADFYVSTNQNPFTLPSQISGALVGTGILNTYPYTSLNSSQQGDLEKNSERLWHPVYFQGAGNIVQLQLSLNDAQMTSTDVRESDFQLHAMCFDAEAIGSRLE